MTTEGAPQSMYDQLVPYATTLSDAQLDVQIRESTNMLRGLRKQAGSENAIAIHNMAIRIVKAEKARRAADRQSITRSRPC